ncbi:MAG: 50S ribosomal protein L1 [uncultured bacterium]|nr:MAG: 50S ribosomal protein L1 [uncultured bacterium]
MGKTKTAILTNEVKTAKTSAEEYAEKKAKKAALNTKEELIINREEITTPEPEIIPELPKKVNKILTVTSRSKKYLESKSKVSKATLYKIEDAIKAVKDATYSKFDGTMELHLNIKKTGVNVQVTLPFSSGKTKKIEIADEKTLAKLKEGKIDFDLLLATAEMMPKLAIFARLLGPKGLMPNPKNGTVIKSEKDAEKFKGNLITLKSEREAPLLHTSFGKVSQKTEELVKNAESILNALGGSKSISKAYMKSTMSPSVKLVI